MITRPLLAATVTDINKLTYPLLVTPKLDGIRCLIINGQVVSRTFKPIPNQYIQRKMYGLPTGLDGELMLKKGEFNSVQSGVMSRDGEPDFEYWVFDFTSTDLCVEYHKRVFVLEYLYHQLTQNAKFNFLKLLRPTAIYNRSALLEYEAQTLSRGHEGVMLRTPNSPYKCGRSTEKEAYLLKLKRFQDSEAEIVGFEEQMENTNVQERDNFGLGKRSTAKDGKVGKETLGKFLVKEVGNTKWKGEKFAIGTGIGLTHKLRQKIWDNQEEYIGKVVTYKYQLHGVVNLPRLPVFIGFRED